MKHLRTPFRAGVLLATVSFAAIAQAQSLTPSPGWAQATPPVTDGLWTPPAVPKVN
jgi:hypothetical protein